MHLFPNLAGCLLCCLPQAFPWLDRPQSLISFCSEGLLVHTGAARAQQCTDMFACEGLESSSLIQIATSEVVERLPRDFSRLYGEVFIITRCRAVDKALERIMGDVNFIFG